MILADMADGVRGLSHRLKNGELLDTESVALGE